MDPKQRTEEAPMPGYNDCPWPDSGRTIFGPWCLLGVWPAVFGVVEEIASEERKKESP